MGDLKKNVSQEQPKRSLFLQRSSPCHNAKFMADGKKIGTICSARAGIIALISF